MSALGAGPGRPFIGVLAYASLLVKTGNAAAGADRLRKVIRLHPLSPSAEKARAELKSLEAAAQPK